MNAAAMHRRTLLSGSASAASLALAGCLDGVHWPGTSAPGQPSCEVELNGPRPDSNRLVEAWTRNDVPPYDVTEPGPSGDGGDWNPEYLGEHLPTDPTLAFEGYPLRHDRVRESVALSPETGTHSYVVALLRTEEEARQVINGAVPALDGSVFVFVGDCCGSSSVEHRWARVEATDAGLHLFGYLRRPRLVTADLAPRYSLLEIERPPDAVDVACASLTVAAEERVHVGSADGVVTLVPAVIANDRRENLAVRLGISTANGETRVDETITVGADVEWKGIGEIGEVTEAFTVDVAIDALDVDLTAEHAGETGPLGIRIRRDGSVAVGGSNEI